jgi:hypothetical protein
MNRKKCYIILTYCLTHFKNADTGAVMSLTYEAVFTLTL